jgi:preprotein translocase subunit SecD
MQVPTCARPYRFTAANYVGSGGGVFAWPHPDPLYSSYPTTLAADDTPSRAIILSSNGQTPSARIVLGPAEVLYKGRIEPVTCSIIKKAYVVHDTADNQWPVVFDLTSTGTNIFNADAAFYYETLIAEDLDGTVIAAPIIEARSFPGSGEIAGDFTEESADELAAELNSGSLPLDIELVSTSR